MLSGALTRNFRFFASMFPRFAPLSPNPQTKLHVIHSSEIDTIVPEKNRDQFKKNNTVQIIQNQTKTIFLSEQSLSKHKIKKNCSVQFSSEIQKQNNFYGLASNLLASAYSFSRKQKDPDQVTIECKEFNDQSYVYELVNANLLARQWTNMRGDEADPQFFLKRAEQISNMHSLKMTVIKGKSLLDQGFRLMHAVGRASEKQPTFINLNYNGNPDSDEWTAFIGKGVCFDSGGLNLKPTSGIKQMHMDKHGAVSVLSAIKSVAQLKLKVNLTVSVGLVENFVSQNSYRPLDIIKSRKGITVQIGNTDAEGRLVLADCMNWTQQKYKVKNMIELSTLTGAIIVALGKQHSGLFSNSDNLSTNFSKAGLQVSEQNWRMPVTSYHHQLIKSKHADITNSPGKPDAASSQAAAFLERFVQKGVQWIHLDIAGTSTSESEATGVGVRGLIQYLKNSI